MSPMALYLEPNIRLILQDLASFDRERHVGNVAWDQRSCESPTFAERVRN